jgi:DNA-binding beta-propeller fold protein YncE
MRLSIIFTFFAVSVGLAGSAMAQVVSGAIDPELNGIIGNLAFNAVSNRMYVSGYVAEPNGTRHYSVSIVDVATSEVTIVEFPTWPDPDGSLIRFRPAYDDGYGDGSGINNVGVNSRTNRIYIPGIDDKGRGQLAVMDGTTNALTLIEFPMLPDFAGGMSSFRPFGGVAVNPNTNRIYVPGGDSSGHFYVVVFDGATSVMTPVRLPTWMDEAGLDGIYPFGGIASNPNTDRIYIPGGDASGHFYMAIMDGATNQIALAQMPTWPDPIGYNRFHPSSSVAINPSTNRIYVPGDDDSGHFYLATLDGATQNISLTPLPTWDVSGLGTDRFAPLALAVNPSTSRAYMRGRDANGHTHLLVADLSTGAMRLVLTDALIGSSDPVVDPSANRLYLLSWWSQYFINAVFVIDLGSSSVPAGQNVSVQTDSALISFDSVTSAGSISVTPITDPASAGQVPGGFAISSFVAYEITPSASLAFSGAVTTCFQVRDINDPADFTNLRVLHEEYGVLIDRTSLQNFSTRTLCAITSSFSPFYVARVGNRVKMLFDQSRAYRSGSTIPVRVQLLTQAGLNIASSSLVLTARKLTLIGAATSISVTDSGNANPDSAFRYDSTLAGYVFNLSSKGLASGRYVLSFWAGNDRGFFFDVVFEVR